MNLSKFARLILVFVIYHYFFHFSVRARSTVMNVKIL